MKRLLKLVSIFLFMVFSLTFTKAEIKEGYWGTSFIKFDTNEGVLTIEEGVLETVEDPSLTLNVPGIDVSRSDVEKIVFQGVVKAPEDSTFLFADYSNLETIVSTDVDYLDTSDVKNMQLMFLASSSLETLDVGNWDTSKVTNMLGMFAYINNLTELNVASWDTSQVIDMSHMFQSTKSLETLDVSNWDTLNVLSMSAMFDDASSLIELDVSNWDVSNVTDMSFMFTKASSLIELDVSNWDTSNLNDMNSMFAYLNNLIELDVSNWDTSNVTSMQRVFLNASSLKKLDVKNWDTSNVYYMDFMFHNTNSLTKLDVSNWDTSNVYQMDSMFHNAVSLTELNVANWDTSNVTSMVSMFQDAISLTELDVSGWNTSKVYSMRDMFAGAGNLRELDVSNWDISTLQYAERMFKNANNLRRLDVSNWNTSTVWHTREMFKNTVSLRELDVSSWNTSNFGDMNSMFEGTSNLIKLDVSNWNTSNVTNMSGLFKNASSLTTLDLSNWNTSKVSNMDDIFTNTVSLQYLKLGENSKFKGTPKLPMINKDGFTGDWIRIEPNIDQEYSNSWNFTAHYNGSHPGLYTWKRNDNIYLKYTITFDSAGGSDVNSISQYENMPIFAPKDPLKEGYTFVDWDPTLPEVMLAENLATTAKWTPATYDMKYHLDGGINNEFNPTKYTVETSDITLQEARKEGYQFLGWYDKETDGTKVVQILKGTTGNLELYAKYIVNEYTISFDTDGGSKVASITQDYGTTIVAPDAPTKEGYTFVDWGPTLPEVMPSENLATTAKWTPVIYDINYHLVGGINNEFNPTKYTVETSDITLQEASKEGYQFLGWYDKETDGTKVVQILKGTTGNLELYAKYIVNEYTISFDTDGGSDVDSITQDYGTTIVAPETPTKEGYTFVSWDQELPKTMPARDLSLQAVFKKDEIVPNYSYEIISGANQVFEKGSTEGLVVIVDADYDNFAGIEIDGATLDSINYSTKKGSVIITLNANNLNGLNDGVYNLSLLFKENNPVKTIFIVKSKEVKMQQKLPDTGSSREPLLFGVLLFVSGLYLVNSNRKKRINK